MARGDCIMPADLPPLNQNERTVFEDTPPVTTSTIWDEILADLPYADAKDRAGAMFDRTYVERLLKRAEGNLSEAARQAGMDRSNFRRLVKKVRGASEEHGQEGRERE
jgi:DNA-binding NtrC family response regulator